MSSMLSLIALTSVVIQAVVSQGEYRRVCYYTNWAQYRPKEGKFLPEDVDPNLCTHMVYAFAKLKGNRLEAFEWNDESTDWMKGMYNRFNDLKIKNPNLKTLLAVGGWNMASKPFTAMVATPASRREFATTSVQFLRDRKFDGLDLDWEYPANRGSPPEDKRRYAELVSSLNTLSCRCLTASCRKYSSSVDWVDCNSKPIEGNLFKLRTELEDIKEIRRAFDEDARRTGRQPLLLTSAVAAGKDKIDTAYDIPSTCRDMDFISIMTYDLHGSWEDITGHNSPLFPHSGETGNQRYLNMDWAANYWVQNGCPKHKLVIGMGLYGRSFTLRDPYDNGLMAPVKGKGEPGKFTREGGFLAYYEICDMKKKGGQTYYIKEQEGPYCVMKDQWVGYDDIDSLRIKVQWMKRNGFSGIMVWALDLDDFKGTNCGQGRYPLMKAINQELRGTIAAPPKSRQNRIKSNPSQRQQNNLNNQNSWDQQNNNWNNNQQNTWEQPPSTTNNNNNWGQQQQINKVIPPTTTPPANMPHLTNEFKCPPNENTYFSSPNSCEDYFICASGLSFKFSCSPPLKWNSVNNFCDWPENVKCNKSPVKTRPVPVPTTRSPPAWKPVTRRFRQPTTRRPITRRPTTRRPRTRRPTTRRPTRPPTTRRPFPPPTTQSTLAQPTPPWLDWSAWIAEFWKALTSMTGGENAWLKQTLESAANKATSQLIGPKTKKFCEGKNDGIHPDPADCSKYFDCVQGREYPGSCPAGTAFDSTYGICDYIHKVSSCKTTTRKW